MPRVVISSLTDVYENLTEGERVKILSIACQAISEVKGIGLEDIEGWWAPVQGSGVNPDRSCIEVYYSVSMADAVRDPNRVDGESRDIAGLVSLRVYHANILPGGRHGVWVMPIVGGAYSAFKVNTQVQHRKLRMS